MSSVNKLVWIVGDLTTISATPALVTLIQKTELIFKLIKVLPIFYTNIALRYRFL